MFEESTWTRRNRRNFEIVERLHAQLGMEVQTGKWELADDTSAAAAIAFLVGDQLLVGSLSAATAKDGKLSGRKEGAAWKSVTTEGGARAAVFLSLATIAMVEVEFIEESIPRTVIEDGRGLVERAYEPPSDDLNSIEAVKQRVIENRQRPEVKEAAERGGMALHARLGDGQATLSFHALQIAGADSASLPGFTDVMPLSEFLTGYEPYKPGMFPFIGSWRAAKDEFLDIVNTRFKWHHESIGSAVARRL